MRIEMTNIRSGMKYNYCMFGVRCAQERKKVRETLLNAGWQQIEQEESYDWYQDAEGNELLICYSSTDCVKSIYAYLSEGILAEKYTASGVQHATSQAMGTLRTTGDVNIRTGPGMEYAIVGMIRANSNASYQGESRTDERGVVWYRIAWDGNEGWVSSKYAELMN